MFSSQIVFRKANMNIKPKDPTANINQASTSMPD